MAYMRDSARPFPLMCIHAAVAAFAAFSFHVITASAAAAVPGHNPTREAAVRPQIRCFAFMMISSPGGDIEHSLQQLSFTWVSGETRRELQRTLTLIGRLASTLPLG